MSQKPSVQTFKPIHAITAKCQECTKGDPNMIEICDQIKCPLFNWRMGYEAKKHKCLVIAWFPDTKSKGHHNRRVPV